MKLTSLIFPWRRQKPVFSLSSENTKRVIDLLHETWAPSFPIYPSTRLKKDLHLDTLEIIEVGMEIEDQYQIRIPTAVIESWKTVADIVLYVDNHHG